MTSEQCLCGGAKSSWAITCKRCWFRVPKVMRQRFFSAPEGSPQRRETLSEILTIIRRPRPPVAATAHHA